MDVAWCPECRRVGGHEPGCATAAVLELARTSDRQYMRVTSFPLEVMKRVHEEVVSQSHRLYPTTDLVRMAALVCEEAGELVGAALDYTRGQSLEECVSYTPTHSLIDVATEARHTAAMAVRMLIEVNRMLAATQANIIFPPTVQEK